MSKVYGEGKFALDDVVKAKYVDNGRDVVIIGKVRAIRVKNDKTNYLVADTWFETNEMERVYD